MRRCVNERVWILGFDLDAKVCIFFHISSYKVWYVQTKADCADTNLSLSVEGVPCKRQEAGGFEGDLNLAGNEHIRLKT